MESILAILNSVTLSRATVIFLAILAVIVVFVEIKEDGKLKLSKFQMTLFMIFLFCLCVAFVSLTNDSTGKDPEKPGLEPPASDNPNSGAQKSADSNNGEKDDANTFTESKDNLPQYSITCKTSNYWGNIELSSDSAHRGEYITVSFDSEGANAFGVLDSSGNYLDDVIPIEAGNTIKLQFVMPEEDVTVVISDK